MPGYAGTEREEMKTMGREWTEEFSGRKGGGGIEWVRQNVSHIIGLERLIGLYTNLWPLI